MHDRTEIHNDTNTPAAGPDHRADVNGSARPPKGPFPSHAQRLALIQDYQSRALEHADPHLASIALIDGDVMLLALHMRELMARDLIEGTSTTEGSRRFAQRADLFLKCVRQIDRNARIKRQLSQLGKEERDLD